MASSSDDDDDDGDDDGGDGRGTGGQKFSTGWGKSRSGTSLSLPRASIDTPRRSSRLVSDAAAGYRLAISSARSLLLRLGCPSATTRERRRWSRMFRLSPQASRATRMSA